MNSLRERAASLLYAVWHFSSPDPEDIAGIHFRHRVPKRVTALLASFVALAASCLSMWIWSDGHAHSVMLNKIFPLIITAFGIAAIYAFVRPPQPEEWIVTCDSAIMIEPAAKDEPATADEPPDTFRPDSPQPDSPSSSATDA